MILIAVVLAKTPFTADERRAVSGLAVLYSLRMLGLFMVLPLLAAYAGGLAGATPALIGLALGAYGLTQASLQIPLGWLSDRIGRRPVILVGLVVFVVGSATAAVSETIAGVITGRFLQGGGAIAAALMALAADYTREDQRTKAMAIIGASIGLSFVIALVAGPLLAAVGGLQLVFWVTAGLGIAGILLVCLGLPHPPPIDHSVQRHGLQTGLLNRAMQGHGLWVLYVSVFLLHAMLMSVFLIIPGRLANTLSLPVDQHWWLYLAGLVLSVPGTLILLRGRRAGEVPRWVLIGGLAALLAGLVAAMLGDSLLLLGLGVALFFAGFNMFEASLPALVSQRAPVAVRGTAMGLFSTGQFLGAFFGGWLGGILLELGGPQVIGQLWVLLVVAWALMLVRTPDVSPEATTMME